MCWRQECRHHHPDRSTSCGALEIAADSKPNPDAQTEECAEATPSQTKVRFAKALQHRKTDRPTDTHRAQFVHDWSQARQQAVSERLECFGGRSPEVAGCLGHVDQHTAQAVEV